MSDQADKAAENFENKLRRAFAQIESGKYESFDSVDDLITHLRNRSHTASRELVEAVTKFLNNGFQHTDLCKQSWEIPLEDRVAWRTRNNVECFGCNPHSALRAALEGQGTKVECEWDDDDGNGPYETGCGRAFEFIEDGVKENGFKCCPYCGLPIKLKEGANEKDI